MRARSASIVRLLVFWTFTILLQWFAGAYQSESALEPDEPAHIVTGLMVRDYLTQGWGHSPIEFARNYYLHYPKVAIGHWPPVFYGEQAAWMLLFPSTRASLLVMMALQVGLLGMLLWPLLEQQYGSLAAWLGCFVLATLPGFYAQSLTVMTEVPIALLVAAGMLSWVRYLDTGRIWYAVWFGLWSSAAILSKGTGVVMAAVPLLSVWLAGRTNLLRRFSFWCPVPVVLLCCAPWYLLAPDATHQRVAAYGGVGLETSRISFPFLPWTAEFGWIVALFAVIGLISILLRWKSHGISTTLASAIPLALGATIAPIFIGAWETRHLVEVAAAFLLIAAAGAGETMSWPVIRKLTSPQKRGALILAFLLTAGWSVRHGSHQKPLGYREFAQSITHDSLGPARTIVVSGNSIAEGALISEIAQLEPHPHRYVLRSSKLFADINWMGHLNQLRENSISQMNAFLATMPIDLIVIDHGLPAPYEYQAMLEQSLEQQPGQWQKVEQTARIPSIAVYRRIQESNISSAQLETQLKTILSDPIP